MSTSEELLHEDFGAALGDLSGLGGGEGEGGMHMRMDAVALAAAGKTSKSVGVNAFGASASPSLFEFDEGKTGISYTAPGTVLHEEEMSIDEYERRRAERRAREAVVAAADAGGKSARVHGGKSPRAALLQHAHATASPLALGRQRSPSSAASL